MYLSEQFLDKVGCDFSKESVRRALLSCELEFRRWYRDGEWERGGGEGELFFKNGSGSVETTERFSELMDFWEVFREFSPLFTGEERKGFFLLRAVRSADQAYHCLLNESILRRLGRDGRERLFSLCRAMGLGTERRTVKIFLGGGQAMRLVYEMETGEGTWGECPGLSAIQNRLAEAMEFGGLVLVEPGCQGKPVCARQEGAPPSRESEADARGIPELMPPFGGGGCQGKGKAGEQERRKGGTAAEKEAGAGEKEGEAQETGYETEERRRTGKDAQEGNPAGQETGRAAYLLGEGRWEPCGLRLPGAMEEKGGFEEQMARIRGEQKGAF